MIVAKHLVKTFEVGDEPLTVLKSVDLSVMTGQFLGVMGPSGSGKSTLLYLLGGLDHPTHGDIYVAGQSLGHLNGEELAAFRSQMIGFVFQAFHLIPTLTALENVGLPGVFLGIPRDVRNERAFQLLKSLGMADRATHRPSQLSGGQQQRVAIARALFNAPPVLMCDEPTGALDSKTGQSVMRLLTMLARKQHKTVVVVTHDPAIANYADRMVHFQDGHVVDDYLTRDRKESQYHVA
ncbi:MAG: ABC transporter ATP-binding protein [Anaerolineae bacterium]|nr:ABC transporter ATP-binding protein [Anaerolineae bacterium]MCA9891995.1 ABC transporter ATP-binding protein [Anaerolineae bacterium]